MWEVSPFVGGSGKEAREAAAEQVYLRLSKSAKSKMSAARNSLRSNRRAPPS